MTTKPEALEYWGTRRPEDLDQSAGEAAGCAVAGHRWPPGRDDGPCMRCGKPSSLPADGGPCCRHGVPRRGLFGGHDCAYADARDALIPYAEAAANRDVPGGDRADRRSAWDAAFHRHMAALARGLVVLLVVVGLGACAPLGPRGISADLGRTLDWLQDWPLAVRCQAIRDAAARCRRAGLPERCYADGWHDADHDAWTIAQCHRRAQEEKTP